MIFPVSGISVSPFIPPLVAFVVSFAASLGGISGAFLLLPFQMSVLHFTSLSVTSTNLFFNLLATPGAISRYMKEGRMVWPLAWILIAGTLPGIFIGAMLRITYLPDPRRFKLFVGLFLLYLGLRLLINRRDHPDNSAGLITSAEERWENRFDSPSSTPVKITAISLARVVYEFHGESYSFRCLPVIGTSFLIGIVGGAYGIGGGSIVAPLLVTTFSLPVYTIAGPTLMSTFTASLAGVIFYCWLGSVYPDYPSLRPDWLLGGLFGIGGLAGAYWGARVQKHIPVRAIKALLGAISLFVASRYIINYFR
ncbi:MAG: sulfite exporter TauE/SafE family protein [Deltaproteobacteria bacterium]|nr:sulfite exporter TauE/SafE family protein [Deltaproteobacteria bacterium]